MCMNKGCTHKLVVFHLLMVMPMCFSFVFLDADLWISNDN